MFTWAAFFSLAVVRPSTGLNIAASNSSATQASLNSSDTQVLDEQAFKASSKLKRLHRLRHGSAYDGGKRIGGWHPVPECVTPRCQRHEGCQGPSCCQEVMFRALVEITEFFDRNAIDYAILFGTLLGAARDKDIIPWTADLDIGIYQRDAPRLWNQDEIPFSFGFTPNYWFTRGCENRKRRLRDDTDATFASRNTTGYAVVSQSHLNKTWHLDEVGSYYIDIYHLDGFGDHDTQGCVAKSGGLPLKTRNVTIRGHQFRAPATVEACLEFDYGKEWRTPLVEKTAHYQAGPKPTVGA